MSTANFCTMDNFPLYVRDFFEESGYCHICRLIQDPVNSCCEICGGELEAEDRYNEFEADDIVRFLEKEMGEFNDGLTFHKISTCPGYYSGLQFYVDEI